MEYGDLNSILLEGKVVETHEKDFVIQSFRNAEDEAGETIKIENRFQIMTPFGRKYTLEKGMNVRIVGRLQGEEYAERITIMPDAIEIMRSEP